MEITPESIKKVRLDLDLTQSELAKRLGVNIKTLSEWELGKAVPRPSHRRQLKELMRQCYGEAPLP